MGRHLHFRLPLHPEHAAGFSSQTNFATTNSTVNGTANTLRPDLIGPLRILGEPEEWSDTSADVFNLLNHPNLGQPGGGVGSPDFGRITNPRFPTGDVGSSRQIQVGVCVEIHRSARTTRP